MIASILSRDSSNLLIPTKPSYAAMPFKQFSEHVAWFQRSDMMAQPLDAVLNVYARLNEFLPGVETPTLDTLVRTVVSDVWALGIQAGWQEQDKFEPEEATFSGESSDLVNLYDKPPGFTQKQRQRIEEAASPPYTPNEREWYSPVAVSSPVTPNTIAPEVKALFDRRITNLLNALKRRPVYLALEQDTRLVQENKLTIEEFNQLHEYLPLTYRLKPENVATTEARRKWLATWKAENYIGLYTLVSDGTEGSMPYDPNVFKFARQRPMQDYYKKRIQPLIDSEAQQYYQRRNFSRLAKNLWNSVRNYQPIDDPNINALLQQYKTGKQRTPEQIQERISAFETYLRTSKTYSTTQIERLYTRRIITRQEAKMMERRNVAGIKELLQEELKAPTRRYASGLPLAREKYLTAYRQRERDSAYTPAEQTTRLNIFRNTFDFNRQYKPGYLRKLRQDGLLTSDEVTALLGGRNEAARAALEAQYRDEAESSRYIRITPDMLRDFASNAPLQVRYPLYVSPKVEMEVITGVDLKTGQPIRRVVKGMDAVGYWADERAIRSMSNAFYTYTNSAQNTREVAGLAATEVHAAYVTGQLQRIVYRSRMRRESLPYFRWVVLSGLESNPCPYCLARNGRVYSIEDLQYESMRLIPAHWLCRCVWVQASLSDYLGIQPEDRVPRQVGKRKRTVEDEVLPIEQQRLDARRLIGAGALAAGLAVTLLAGAYIGMRLTPMRAPRGVAQRAATAKARSAASSSRAKAAVEKMYPTVAKGAKATPEDMMVDHQNVITELQSRYNTMQADTYAQAARLLRADLAEIKPREIVRILGRQKSQYLNDDLIRVRESYIAELKDRGDTWANLEERIKRVMSDHRRRVALTNDPRIRYNERQKAIGAPETNYKELEKTIPEQLNDLRQTTTTLEDEVKLLKVELAEINAELSDPNSGLSKAAAALRNNRTVSSADYTALSKARQAAFRYDYINRALLNSDVEGELIYEQAASLLSKDVELSQVFESVSTRSNLNVLRPLSDTQDVQLRLTNLMTDLTADTPDRLREVLDNALYAQVIRKTTIPDTLTPKLQQHISRFVPDLDRKQALLRDTESAIQQIIKDLEAYPAPTSLEEMYRFQEAYNTAAEQLYTLNRRVNTRIPTKRMSTLREQIESITNIHSIPRTNTDLSSMVRSALARDRALTNQELRQLRTIHTLQSIRDSKLAEVLNTVDTTDP